MTSATATRRPHKAVTVTVTDGRVEASSAPEIERGLAVRPEVADPQVMALLRAAVEKGVAVETLERLMTLHERIAARQAEGEFLAARAQFQAECPAVAKKSSADFTSKGGGRISYSYAELDEIARTIRPHLHRLGLSYSWDSSVENGKVKAVCFLEHVAGGKKTATFEAPLDDRASMSGPQRVAAALTYARRQTLIQVLGLTTTDEDDDARPAVDARVVRRHEEPEDEAGREIEGERPETPPAPAGAVPCPKCGGATIDKREGKKNPKGPDFACADNACRFTRTKEGAWVAGNYPTAVWARDLPAPPASVFDGVLAARLDRKARSASIVQRAAVLGLATRVGNSPSELQRIVGKFGGKVSTDLPDMALNRIDAALASIAAEEIDLSYAEDGTPMAMRDGEDVLAPVTEDGKEMGW